MSFSTYSTSKSAVISVELIFPPTRSSSDKCWSRARTDLTRGDCCLSLFDISMIIAAPQSFLCYFNFLEYRATISIEEWKFDSGNRQAIYRQTHSLDGRSGDSPFPAKGVSEGMDGHGSKQGT